MESLMVTWCRTCKSTAVVWKVSGIRNLYNLFSVFFFFQAEDGIRDIGVTGVQTCALPIYNTFGDHYLEVDYDLSQVMFVTTANSLNMPQPLLDRMEIIRIPGYTEDEKVEIAKRHVLPKVMKDNGLKDGELIVPDETIRNLIRYYTREAGVRNLERELGNLARKAVRDLMRETAISITVDDERLAKYAGVKKHRYGETDAEDQVGIVTGLAWTEFGGDILTIEAVRMTGKGRMTVTGNLKDVMKESISAASSYRSEEHTSELQSRQYLVCRLL